MGDIIEESFIKKEAPKVLPPQESKTSKAANAAMKTYETLKSEGSKLANLIIADRQREMVQNGTLNPSLVSSLTDPPIPILKKRGRPRKNPETGSVGSSSTPERNVSFHIPTTTTAAATRTPPSSPKGGVARNSSSSSSKTPLFLDPKRNLRIRQIKELCKLYPKLVNEGYAPNPEYYPYHELSDSQLEDLFKECKKNGATSSGEFEFQFVSSSFYKILDQFETICYLVSLFFPIDNTDPTSPVNPILSIVCFLARQPHGSFSKYVHHCILAGDDMEKDLREISIDLMGYFPNSPYARLALKVAYRAYDYARFQTDIVINEAMQRAQQASCNLSPEQQMFFENLGGDYPGKTRLE